MAAEYRALVRRRRDGHVVFDLDPVHAGVVAEALEQTRAVLDEAVDEPTTKTAAPRPVEPVERVEPAVNAAGVDAFDAIVAGLGMGPGEDADAGEAELVRGDPVLRRLLPDAYLDDPEGSADFRRLSGGAVRGHKVEAIDSVLADLDQLRAQDGGVAVAPERAAAWLTALNDARLALGTLLALGEDDDLYAELEAYEQAVEDQVATGGEESEALQGEAALRAYRIAVYDFLSALLDMVVRVLDR